MYFIRALIIFDCPRNELGCPRNSMIFRFFSDKDPARQVTGFLELQGQQRLAGAKGGRKSAELRKGLPAKKYAKKS